MPVVRFNALSGSWERRERDASEFTPITRAAAQVAMFEGVRQEPMWRGPEPPRAR